MFKIKVIITDEMGDNRVEIIEITEATVGDILKRLDIDPFVAIVEKKGEIITENHVLKNEDEIKIVDVIHGG